MCGILGQINFKEKISEKRLINLRKSLSMMAHRGPDAQGTFIKNNVFLGHRRLSIIDTSSRANQPFKHKDYVLVFNGEIYNFKFLKEKLEKKGHKFSTSSDTEVLLKSYLEWGEDFVDRLDGMWAFCIYDIKKDKFILSRDRIGEKPLVYYFDENKFIFSSEIPPLLKLLEENEKKISYARLAQFNLYNFSHMPYDLTPFEKVNKVRPGYNLIIQSGKMAHKKYLRIEKKKIKEPIKEFKEKFRKCVEQTCISDVPVGIFFSGGVDSSLVAKFLPNKNIRAYCFGMDENDTEITRARKVAKILGLELKEVYLKDTKIYKNVVNSIKEVIKQYGEPINLLQILYSDLLLNEMKKDGIKVAIGGNGADELFYGYDGANNLYLASYLKDISERIKISFLLRVFPKTRPLSLKNFETKSKFYEEEISGKTVIKEEYRNFLFKGVFKELSNEIPSKKLIDVFNWIGLRIENEHSITMVADISGMRKSMEIRTPFLNKEMLNFAENLDSKLKVRSFFIKSQNKYILRKILEEFLPKDLAYSKKMGFGYNIDVDLIIQENIEEFRYYIYEVVPKIEVYDSEKVKQIYQEYLNGNKKYGRLLLEILIVAIWFKEIVIKEEC